MAPKGLDFPRLGSVVVAALTGGRRADGPDDRPGILPAVFAR